MKRLLGNLLARVNPDSDFARQTVWNGHLDKIRGAVKERKYEKIDGHLSHALQWLEMGPEDRHDLHLKLSELADMYQSMIGNNSVAEKLYLRAVEIVERRYGKEHIEIAVPLNSLALLLMQQRRHDEAGSYLERLLPIVERAYGPDHPELASCLENLAAVFRQTNRTSEANQLRSRAMKIRRATQG